MKSCLVIEESEVIASFAAGVFSDLSVEATIATDAASAIAALEAASPDLLFLDWDLPQLGALDILKRLASVEEDKRPLVVMATTENDLQQIAVARAAGVATILFKPYDEFQLTEALTELGFVKPAANKKKTASGGTKTARSARTPRARKTRTAKKAAG
ncbi:MAG: response regulator [Pseudomonadota bacterium]